MSRPRHLVSNELPPSAAEILQHIPSATRQKRYWPALGLFVWDYLSYIALLIGIILVPTWWFKGLLALAAAGVIGRLFILGHDAGHDTLTPSWRWNWILGQLAFFTTYTPMTSWRYAHNVLHHNFLRIAGKDPVWCPWSLEEYRRRPWWHRLWYRTLRTPLGLPFYWLVENWIKHFLFPSRQAMSRRWGAFNRDRVLVAAFALAQCVFLWGITQVVTANWLEPLPWWAIPLAILLPYFLWSYTLGFVDVLHHTHPGMLWYSTLEEWDYFQANVRCTTHVVMPFGLRRMLHNILLHTAHHADPRVPLTNLPTAQSKLEEAYAGDITVVSVTPAYIWNLWRVCQLYDFERHCWLNYAGEPTSEPLAVLTRKGFGSNKSSETDAAEPTEPISAAVIERSKPVQG